jgi:alpha-mannosidase
MISDAKVTVHMIGNAHLDPVWLWHWQRGADEAVATCRAACDLLDDYPDVVFTRGEAWVYEQVRTLEPELFERIRGHIRGGRWAVVNGWWVQADTILPTAEALHATARLGQEWFREHLGMPEVPVGYLVDSFGHSAALPEILRRAGQRYFVMMRPMQHEKPLPSCIFNWRGTGGATVLTYRIPGGYLCNTPDNGWLEGHLRTALATPRPAGIHDIMCFYGVGDHGGGPTRKAVEWIKAHREFAPGVRLEFSSPQRYFAAVEAAQAELPTVEGELQMHAIGCYSVCGALKRDIRQAELALADAEALLAHRGLPEPAQAAELNAAWRTVCFNQFHDILPGSSIAEAIVVAQRQVGGALDRAETLTHRLLRGDERVRACTLDGQRLHAVNRTDAAWKGLVEFEVWLDWQNWEHQIVDAAGRVVPHQRLTPDSVVAETFSPIPRLLFPLELGPHALASLRLVPNAPAPAPFPGPAPRFENGRLTNGLVEVEFDTHGIAQLRTDGVRRLARPVLLASLTDGSDTWSHDLDRYTGPLHALGEFAPPQVVEDGPLRVAVRLEGRIGNSRAQLYVGLERDSRRLDCRLQVNYREALTVLKASLAPALPVASRRDRIAGGWFTRPCDGREYPVHHALRLSHANGGGLGVVFPDSFAADVTQDGAVRITLLRNNIHAYHSTARLPQEEVPQLRERFGTDEGPQTLRFSIALDGSAGETELEEALTGLQRPPWLWDDFRGGTRVARFEK